MVYSCFLLNFWFPCFLLTQATDTATSLAVAGFHVFCVSNLLKMVRFKKTHKYFCFDGYFLHLQQIFSKYCKFCHKINMFSS
jgi:hypothetical protein